MGKLTYWKQPIEGNYRLREEIDGGRNHRIVGVVATERDAKLICYGDAEIDRLQALLDAKTTPGYEMLAGQIEKKDAEIAAIGAAATKLLDFIDNEGPAAKEWQAITDTAEALRALITKAA